MLRGKQVDEQIILMMEAYLKLYYTMDTTGWEDFGGIKACRMCKLVGLNENKIPNCTACPLYIEQFKGNFPCVSDMALENTHARLCYMLDELKYNGSKPTDKIFRQIVKDRIEFLYNRLKENGYF